MNAVNRVGFKRSVEDIKKKYTTFSSDVRKKAAQISTHSRRTGGGPPIELHLSETEASIVATINPQLIEGITGGIDTEFVDSFDESNNTIEILSVEDMTVDSTLVRESKDNSNEVKSKPNKRKFISSNENIEINSLSEKMVGIENEKINLKKIKLNLVKIKLNLKIKELNSNGIDTTEESEQLKTIIIE